MTIGIYQDLTTLIYIYRKGLRVIQKVKVAKEITIPPKTIIIILTFYIKKNKLPYNYNYIFKGLFNNIRDIIISYYNFIIVIKGLRARIKLEGLATFNIYIPRIINNKKVLRKI